MKITDMNLNECEEILTKKGWKVRGYIAGKNYIKIMAMKRNDCIEFSTVEEVKRV